MDGRFTEEQNMLRDSVQKLMAKHCAPDFMRKIDNEKSYPYDLYAAWAEAGLFAMPFAEASGDSSNLMSDSSGCSSRERFSSVRILMFMN